MKSLYIFMVLSFVISNVISCQDNTVKRDSMSSDQKVSVEKAGVTGYLNMSVTEFKTGLEQDSSIILIDVRTPEEISQGKIDGALELDYYEESFGKKILEMDREKTYYLYCRSGNRSGKTARFMIENGFKNIVNLEGGFIEWEKEH